ncbi:helix-turn-helix domain-containing protein [Ancylobacter polymorphus]|uniref:helix-turn-helix domain-containing protein n=1 Tax=Ancylobacter polymorphus TaxID=223390 RepID=UPI003D766E76
MIAALEEGLSTRKAARRFRVGISTARTWRRRYRESGKRHASRASRRARSSIRMKVTSSA